MAPIVTLLLTGLFPPPPPKYCSYTSAGQLIRGVFHLDISLLCWFRVIRVLFCVFLSLIVEEADRVWDKKSEDTTTLDVQTLLKTFLNMSLRSVCFIADFFFLGGIKQLPVLGLLSTSAPLPDLRLKEFCCIYIFNVPLKYTLCKQTDDINTCPDAIWCVGLDPDWCDMSVLKIFSYLKCCSDLTWQHLCI